MARVTVEDCLALVPNRFALTVLASRRARALGEGRGHAMVECDNKEGVTALREIGDGKVRFGEDVNQAMIDFIEEQRRQLRVTSGEHTFLEAAALGTLEDDEGDAEEGAEELEELPIDPESLVKKPQVPEEETDEPEFEAAAQEEGFEAPSEEDAFEPEEGAAEEELGTEVVEEEEA